MKTRRGKRNALDIGIVVGDRGPRRGNPASCMGFVRYRESIYDETEPWGWFEEEFGRMPDGKPFFQQRWVLCKVLMDSTSGLVRSCERPGLITESVLHGCNHRHRSVMAAVTLQQVGNAIEIRGRNSGSAPSSQSQCLLDPGGSRLH